MPNTQIHRHTDWLTDTWTDLAMRDICSNRPHLHMACGWCSL